MEQTIQKKVEVEASLVRVEVYGDPDGPALVLLPGTLSDARAWRHVAQRLERWPAVAVVNRRGRHPSGPLGEGYGLGVEVADAAAVLRSFADVRAVFGWSYGGLIALEAAGELAIPHVIAYEPVAAPFGAEVLSVLRGAHRAGDLDGVLEIALRRVAGMDDQAVAALRAQRAQWAELRRLSAPLYEETAAIAGASTRSALATRAARVDLIVGERNRGRVPYGTTFEDVARRVAHADVHCLEGQGHLAHLEAPGQLAELMDSLCAGAR